MSDAERVLRSALEWYQEKATALRRYDQKPIKAEAMEAVVTELMLDHGDRADAALRTPQQPPSGDVRDYLDGPRGEFCTLEVWGQGDLKTLLLVGDGVGIRLSGPKNSKGSRLLCSFTVERASLQESIR